MYIVDDELKVPYYGNADFVSVSAYQLIHPVLVNEHLD